MRGSNPVKCRRSAGDKSIRANPEILRSWVVLGIFVGAAIGRGGADGVMYGLIDFGALHRKRIQEVGLRDVDGKYAEYTSKYLEKKEGDKKGHFQSKRHDRMTPSTALPCRTGCLALATWMDLMRTTD